MEIVEMPVGELVPYDSNPRNNDDAVQYVKASIEEFGFKVPIVIDRDNVVVAGHTRLKAALKLGLQTVPCIVADDLTPEQVKAFRLADNKTAEFAVWDEEREAQELAKILGIDMEMFGFEKDVMSISDYFDETQDEPEQEEKEEKPKMITCPYCGEVFNVKEAETA